MAYRDLPSILIAFVRARSTDPQGAPNATEMTAHAGVSRSSVNRTLVQLVKEGRIEKLGSGRATVYRPAGAEVPFAPGRAVRSPEARALRASLS